MFQWFQWFQRFQGFRSTAVKWFHATVVVVVSATFASGQAPVVFDGPGYRVLLPNGITGATEPQVDFEITTFRKSDGTVLLSAYSGLHPNFNERDARDERINGMRAKRLAWTDPSKGRCAEVLVTLRSGGRGFVFSGHFWYCAISEADVRQAEAIIRSVR